MATAKDQSTTTETETTEPPVPGIETAQTGQEPETPRDDDGFVSQPVANRQENGPFLRGYSDIGTDRVVTTADFASVGIDQENLTFNWLKGYKLPLAGINPAAVEYLVANEYGFSVVDE